jgi:hypothetical protein
MKEIQCTKGRVAIVSDEDYELLNKFRWQGSVYPQVALRRRNGKTTTVSMHTFILRGPSELVIDHINGDTYDNRRENLRLVTHQQNMTNSKKHKITPHNPYKGVHAANYVRYGLPLGKRGKKRQDPWKASICIEGKNYLIGKFKTAEEAAEAYDRAALEAFGDYARLNFPQILKRFPLS